MSENLHLKSIPGRPVKIQLISNFYFWYQHSAGWKRAVNKESKIPLIILHQGIYAMDIRDIC